MQNRKHLAPAACVSTDAGLFLTCGYAVAYALLECPFDVCWLELAVRVWVVLLGLGGVDAAWSCTWGVLMLIIDLELYES
jgi:hypothetical protein